MSILAEHFRAGYWGVSSWGSIYSISIFEKVENDPPWFTWDQVQCSILGWHTIGKFAPCVIQRLLPSGSVYKDNCPPPSPPQFLNVSPSSYGICKELLLTYMLVEGVGKLCNVVLKTVIYWILSYRTVFTSHKSITGPLLLKMYSTKSFYLYIWWV